MTTFCHDYPIFAAGSAVFLFCRAAQDIPLYLIATHFEALAVPASHVTSRAQSGLTISGFSDTRRIKRVPYSSQGLPIASATLYVMPYIAHTMGSVNRIHRRLMRRYRFLCPAATTVHVGRAMSPSNELRRSSIVPRRASASPAPAYPRVPWRTSCAVGRSLCNAIRAKQDRRITVATAQADDVRNVCLRHLRGDISLWDLGENLVP